MREIGRGKRDEICSQRHEGDQGSGLRGAVSEDSLVEVG